MHTFPATLGDFHGVGYAQVRRHGHGRVSCDGIFTTAEPGALRRFSEELRFEGVVYSGAGEARSSMLVLVHSKRTKDGITTFLFVSRGDPHEQDGPA